MREGLDAMARPLKLEIQETQAELKTLLEQQTTIQAKERLQVLYLLKGGKVRTVTGLAHSMGRHRVTLQKWLKVYRKQGLEGLMAVQRKGGRRSSVPQWAIEALRNRLHRPATFNTYTEVQDWFRDSLGLKLSYRVVYGLVHDQLKIQLKELSTNNAESMTF